MEQRRKQCANEIRLQITRVQKAQERDAETVLNLGRLGLPEELVKRKRVEFNEKREEREEEIFELEEKERMYLEGRLDKEIEDSYQKQKKPLVEVKKEVKKEVNKEPVRRSENDERLIQKDYKYYYRQFCKAEETLPDYMRRNLDDMPNNKGYIWRGCWFLGNKRPERGNVMIMFEKQRGGILRINEIDDYEHRIFEKVGKERKREISVTVRKNRKKLR